MVRKLDYLFMLIPSIVAVIALSSISLSIDCTNKTGDSLMYCNQGHYIIWFLMGTFPTGMFAIIRAIVLVSENKKKKLLLHDKVTTISDDDKTTFNALWANHLLKKWDNPEDDKPLQDFIMYMARTYSFDCTNFQLVDKERNLVHMRIPRI